MRLSESDTNRYVGDAFGSDKPDLSTYGISI